MPKQRIAILGGGLGAVTTAFELTNSSDWKDRYEITVYQLGWRLGGKGASGRSADPAKVIEEHGLHVFMGFYDNAFHMMKTAYEECAARKLTPRSPFTTLDDAFTAMNLIVLTEQVGKDFELWPMPWPPNNERPGNTTPLTGGGVKPFVVRLILLALDQVLGALPVAGPLRTLLLSAAQKLADTGILAGLVSGALRVASAVSRFSYRWLRLPGAAGAFLAGTRGALRIMGTQKPERANTHEGRLSTARAAGQGLYDRMMAGDDIAEQDLQALCSEAYDAIRLLIRAFQGLAGELDPNVRRGIVAADLALTIARGILDDRLLDGDFDRIDDQDLNDWLTKHGSLFRGRSVLTRAFYDAAFAYADGDPERPNFSAGRALYGIIRLVLTYRGSITWRMNAGMGETIFTPLFKVLEDRGVKFEFFHKITNLGLSADRKRVERIEIDVQAELKPECNGRYDPLVDVETAHGTLACWPDRPNYDQLVQGVEMQSPTLKNPDLESSWTDWRPTPATKRTLVLGADFDKVVLGIPVGALPLICGELIAQPGMSTTTPNFEALQKWRMMTTEIKSIRTQGLQLWLNRTLPEMGFSLPPRFTETPLLCAFVEPYDTWCDMTHLAPMENLQPPPKQIAYFCNAAPSDPRPAGFNDHEYPARQTAQARLAAEAFLNQHARTIWSDCMDNNAPTRFDRSAVIRDFLRLNIDPSELYVLNVKGSGKHRLSPASSGFENLYLAGDWTQCVIDLGCAEAAVISGKLAAAGIGHVAPQIFGLIGAKMEDREISASVSAAVP